LNSISSTGETVDPGSTDSSLLEGIHAHDEQAWMNFVEVYSPIIYVWCRQFDLQPADALDVSQQVFHAVNRSISTFSYGNGKGSFRGWLWTITRNLVRNHVTRTLRGPQPKGGTSIQLRLMQEPESMGEASIFSTTSSTRWTSMRAILDSARADFDDRTWQCFWLVTMEGYSAVEVAEQLGMKPAAVRQAKYRVSKRLRRDLDDFS
jgi:RNA polymerase sigma-70 factor (ECF subfamily)